VVLFPCVVTPKLLAVHRIDVTTTSLEGVAADDDSPANKKAVGWRTKWSCRRQTCLPLYSTRTNLHWGQTCQTRRVGEQRSLWSL